MKPIVPGPRAFDVHINHTTPMLTVYAHLVDIQNGTLMFLRYTDQGAMYLTRALAPGGWLGVQSPEPSPEWETAMRRFKNWLVESAVAEAKRDQQTMAGFDLSDLGTDDSIN